METWKIHPDDLGQLTFLWGHKGLVAWENILAEIPSGRVVASKDKGELIILRDFAFGEHAWKAPPFNLGDLPTLGKTLVPSQNGLFQKEPSSKLALFLNDVFTEELLDRDGLRIRISNRWHFVDDFSRLSPYIRVERAIRLDYNDTFSVFDIYSFGGEFLLGSHSEDSEGAIVETGALLNLDKSVVVILSGLPTWYSAVFSMPLNPKHFPHTVDSIKKLPLNVRFVFPSTSGFSLAE